ncbi:DUF2237 family protein [Rubritalea marina]|uniref:DUF2237 family protein n=1 Tax=Rubritalea marina TaxID=361055 RepID=UPI00047794E9|nr:DUF2237 domain-containing protein [Rubritalea marina]
MSKQSNVLGTPLQKCSTQPLTGFMRDGYCSCCAGDHGLHTVCASVTAEFLEFSRSRGNDLSTPHPEYGFPGLKPGDCWCLCVTRWVEAYQSGSAPKVHLEATHLSALEYIDLETLKEFATEPS